MRNSVLFVTPPYHCGVVEVAGSWIPGQFVFLAASARKAGVEPILYDAMTIRAEHSDIIKKVQDLKPDYLATTAITSTINDSLCLLKNAKEIDPGIITILGGVHPSFCYQEILSRHSDFVDYIVVREGEITFAELLEALEKGKPVSDIPGIAYFENSSVCFTGERDFVKDLDSLECDWDILDWKNYTYYVFPGSTLGAVSTSRGCDSDCTFCSQQKFWKQSWRGRKAENVVNEMEMLHNKYGVNVLLIGDEFPTKDRDRWEEILDRLIRKKMDIRILMETRVEDIVRDRDIIHKYKKAGIVHIYIGVESVNQEVLNFIKKDLKAEMSKEAIDIIHSQGIITETSFLLGFPNETKESIENTLKLSQWYNPDFAHYLAITPWPYSDLYPEMKPFIREFDYSKYNLIDPIIEPESMSMEEIDKAIVDCYRRFYMGKFSEIIAMKDEFKKKYLLVSMKLIMNSSFLIKKLGTLGKMPQKIAEYMQNHNIIP